MQYFINANFVSEFTGVLFRTLIIVPGVRNGIAHFIIAFI